MKKIQIKQIDFFKKAYLLGEIIAPLHLAKLYRDMKNYEEALRWDKMPCVSENNSVNSFIKLFRS